MAHCVIAKLNMELTMRDSNMILFVVVWCLLWMAIAFMSGTLHGQEQIKSKLTAQGLRYDTVQMGNFICTPKGAPQ